MPESSPPHKPFHRREDPNWGTPAQRKANEVPSCFVGLGAFLGLARRGGSRAQRGTVLAAWQRGRSLIHATQRPARFAAAMRAARRMACFMLLGSAWFPPAMSKAVP